MPEQPRQLCPKRLIVARRKIRALERFNRLDKRFGHEAPAELAKVAAHVRIASRHDR
jgi:hypothetical protein